MKKPPSALTQALIITLIVSAALLAGCSIITEARSILTEGRDLNIAATGGKGLELKQSAPNTGFDYTLLIENKGMKLSMYEPVSGCYLGVNPWRDRRLEGSVTSFDRLSGKNHAVIALEIVLGEEPPEEMILECIARKKALLITITPPNIPDPYSEELLLKTAADLGAYNVPIFINFYPYAKNMGFGAQYYKKFYRRAWLAFRELAQHAAMVWSINVWDAETCLDYYPGDNYVEWVGINITAGIETVGSGFGYGGFTASFDSFCEHFQDNKPIMVTNLSLSHFSTLNNTYYTDLCARTISEFYGYLADSWPRVKAVVYNGYTEIGGQVSAKRSQNNFLLTEEDALVQAYAAAVKDDGFITFVPSVRLSDLAAPGKSLSPQFVKSPYNAIFSADNNAYYIPEKSLDDLSMDSSLFSPSVKTPYILGERCYSLEDVSRLAGGEFEVDENRKVIYWRK